MNHRETTLPEFSVVDAASADAQFAMRRYVEELLGRLPHGFTVEEALATAEVAYNPPAGLFVVAAGDPHPVAGGALRFLDETRAEVKRMWVDPEARGRGLATQLLARLEQLALEHGRSVMVLDTNTGLAAAVRLYEREGYSRIPRYNDNPDADVWFEKALRSRS
ncbi:MAG TPA: GNAT family N-acetyltransferase [Marmoricola sp.]